MIRQQRDRIFLTFLRSYILLLLLLLGTGGASYFTALQVVENEIVETNRTLLDQSRRVLESRFTEVENILSQLARHPQVTRLTYSENPLEGGGSLVELQELRDLLIYYKWNDSFLKSLDLFFKGNGLVVTSEDIYMREAPFYEHFFKYGDYGPEDWEAKLFSSLHYSRYLPPEDVILGGEADRLIGIIQSVSIKGYGLTKSGVVVGFIREQAVTDLLESTLLQDGGAAYIIDCDGRVLAAVGDRALAGREALKTSMTSPDRGWTYISMVPRRMALHKMIYLRRIMMSILLFSLLGGVALSFYFARRTSAPLRTIRAILAERDMVPSAGGELDGYPEAVRKLLNSNRSFREQIEGQQGFLKVSFLDSLVRGKYGNENDAALHYASLDDPFLSFPLAVISLSFPTIPARSDSRSFRECHAFRLVVRTLVQELLKGNGLCHDTGPDSLVILRHTPELFFKREIEGFSAKLLSLLSGGSEQGLLITCGSRAESYLEVARSFEEAEGAKDYLYRSGEDAVRWYSDIPGKGRIAYTLDREQKIINAVLAGDDSALSEWLLEIRESGFVLNRPSLEGCRQFRHDIRYTLLKIRERMDLDEGDIAGFADDLNSLSAYHREELFFAGLDAMLCRLASLQKSRQRSHNRILADELTDYIEGHCGDSQLCLCSLADHFHLSETYLSQFFKEQTGENFSVCLEKLRIKRSLDLMKEDWSLAVIAEKCGYNSPQVFRRAFKRLEGVSPSCYREELLKKSPLP